MGIVDHLATAAEALGQAFLVIAVGIIATRYPRSSDGVLSKPLLKQLARLLIFLCTPALTIANFSSTLTAEKAGEGWTILMWALVQLIVSSIVAAAVLPFARVPEWFRPVFIMSNVFPNAFSLPVILIESVVSSSDDFDNTDDKALDEAIVYIMIYLIVWNVVFWAVGLSLTPGDVPTPETLAAPVLSGTAKVKAVLGRALLTPPMIATFIGVVLGITGIGRHVLFNDDAPLAFVGRAMRLVSLPALVLPSLIMASSLYRGLQRVAAAKADKAKRLQTTPPTPAGSSPPGTPDYDTGAAREGVTTISVVMPQEASASSASALVGAPPDALEMVSAFTIFVLIVCKLLLVPAALFGLYLALEPYGFAPEATIARLSLLVIFSAPSAQFVAVVAEMKHKSLSTQSLALAYLPMYLTSGLTMTLFLSWALSIVL